MGEMKCFSVQVKVRALHRVWSGEKIAEVAREYGVSRQMLYYWKRKAETAIFQALNESKRGPRVRETHQNSKLVRMQEKVKELSQVLQKTQQKVKLLERRGGKLSHTDNNSNNKRPERCPVCGCEKIYKNGTYIRKNKNADHNQEQVVQRYICVWCKNSIYVEQNSSTF